MNQQQTQAQPLPNLLPIYDGDELRRVALGIEEALAKGSPLGVTITRPATRTVIRALWDLADRFDLD